MQLFDQQKLLEDINELRRLKGLTHRPLVRLVLQDCVGRLEEVLVGLASGGSAGLHDPYRTLQSTLSQLAQTNPVCALPPAFQHGAAAGTAASAACVPHTALPPPYLMTTVPQQSFFQSTLGLLPSNNAPMPTNFPSGANAPNSWDDTLFQRIGLSLPQPSLEELDMLPSMTKKAHETPEVLDGPFGPAEVLTCHTWEQKAGMVRVYVPLRGITNEKIHPHFYERKVYVWIENYKGHNYVFRVDPLFRAIDVNVCSAHVSKSKANILIDLKKLHYHDEEDFEWKSLTGIKDGGFE